ncbi:MAG: drug/metabolite transporter (DMT)-like permease, partial [Gammaproteobacteria bacterium]
MTASPALLSVACLIASGLLDLVFKLYARKPRSRGMLIFGVGCVWTGLQLAYITFADLSLVLNHSTLVYGVTAAFFVTVSNILLLECLGQLPISMASTIYRLNTIPLVVLAFLFLREDIDLLKGAGIVMGIITVFLLYQPSNNPQQTNGRVKLYLMLIIIASCIRALYGIFTKVGINEGADPATMMLFAAIGWCVGGLSYAYFREKRVVLTADKLVFIPIAGILVFSIIWLLTTALSMD